MKHTRHRTPISRRQFVQAGTVAGAGLVLGRPLDGLAELVEPLPLITRPIPSSGEQLPAVGLGTNNYSVTAPEDLALRREVLERLPDLGGSVVDTAPAYGLSESVIGRLVAELDNRKRLFLATKVTTAEGDPQPGRAMIEESFGRLRTDRIDLLQVHNLMGVETLVPVLAELKQAGRIRYIGVTTSRVEQHAELVDVMRRHELDFIQVNYSIEDRAAAERILPLAEERGMAVLINMPFGGRRGGNLFARVTGHPLPEWAAEIDVASWAQFFLKYVVSHPAVTCAIPGTHRLHHLEDNLQGARGAYPDAGFRRRMENFWDEAIASDVSG